MKYKPLSRHELISVIEGKGNAKRVPILLHFWIIKNSFLGEKRNELEKILLSYPEDALRIGIRMPDLFRNPEEKTEYSWVNFPDPYKSKNVPYDSRIAMNDWDIFENVLEYFPDPHFEGIFPLNPQNDGRYRLGMWWQCFFERHWSLRGMTNSLMDFYTDPEKVHKLYSALTDFYLIVIERAKNELSIDGIFVSDDLGTQQGPFFSPEIFCEFFKPYYKRLINKAHSLGMHFWLHCCGNIELFLPHFIEIGLDVIHPIQKYTMDEKKINQQFGKDLCIWAGFDVQQVIPWGTPEDVRREVRFLMDTYRKPEGRFMLTAGNAIHDDCTIPSLEALFDEAFRYGNNEYNNK
jgi:uroporphyrinogen decarboxylase